MIRENKRHTEKNGGKNINGKYSRLLHINMIWTFRENVGER